MSLDPTTQISGLIVFLSSSFFFALALIILSKAIKRKEMKLYMFFVFMVSLNTPWYPAALGYIFWVITQHVFLYEVYILLGTLGIPVIPLSFYYIYTNLIKPDWKKPALTILGIMTLLYDITILCLLFIPGVDRFALIGEPTTPLDIEYNGAVLVLIAVCLAITIPPFVRLLD